LHLPSLLGSGRELPQPRQRYTTRFPALGPLSPASLHEQDV
jgi:hypothetical protein